MQAYPEGTRLEGPGGEYVVRNGVPVLVSPAAPQTMQIKPADPNIALDRTVKQLQIGKAMREAATAPADARKAEAEARKAEAEAAKLERDQRSNNPNGLTAEDRGKALTQYRQIPNLERGIAELEQRYKRDFAPNKGVAALREYLPGKLRSANAEFNDASNGLSAFIASALGLSGQQFNTPTEQQLFLGSILPKASDTDGQISEKIRRLKVLVAQAKAGGQQMLGGKLDANGNIVPATGATKEKRDDEATALVNMLIRGGSTPDEINTALKPLGLGPVDPKQVKAAQEYYRRNPKDKSGVAEVVREEPTSAFERLSASPVGAFFGSAGNGVTAGLLDEIGGTAQAWVTGRPTDEVISEVDKAKKLLASSQPLPAFFGEMVGTGIGALGAGAALPGRLGAPLAADALYGAAYGAGENNDNRLLGAGLGAAGGIVGNRIGAGVASGVGRAYRGVQDEAVNLLRRAGIRQTGGQMLGGFAKKVEDAAMSVPVLGDAIRARRLDGIEDFNRAAFDQATAPINYTTQGVTGARGVDLLREARSQAYRDTLDPVTLTIDPEFGVDYTNAALRGADLPQVMAENADATLRMRVADNVGTDGVMTGNDVQQSIRGLRRDAKSMEKLPYGYDFGQVTRDAEGAIEGLLARQSPDTLPQFQAANAANRNVEIVRDAVNRARNGARSGEVQQFMPSQLADAAAANARRFGGTQGTTQAPFFNLTEAGQSVLPSELPDSGTATRLLHALAGTSLLGGAGAGAGYVAGGSEGATTGTAATAGAVGALALLNTRAGQAAVARALLDRHNAMVRAGNYLVDAAPRVGRIGGAGGATLAVQSGR